MLKDAKVVTSKFLQLRDKLNNAIRDNKGYDNSIMRAHGTSEVTCNIWELQKAFGELCELLHELTTEETNVNMKETNANMADVIQKGNLNGKERTTCSHCGSILEFTSSNVSQTMDYDHVMHLEIWHSYVKCPVCNKYTKAREDLAFEA